MTSPVVTNASHATARLTKLLVRLLEESRAQTHLRVSEHFERAVRVWAAVLLLQSMDVWLPLCEGLEKGLTPLGQALGLLMEHAAGSYEDLLGRVYMELSQQDKGLGQYFTPFPVAQMMASIKCQDVVLPEPGAPPLRCLEPSCGSGVMLLAIAEQLETRFPGAIARGEAVLLGIDLDPLCTLMANLNMRLHRIGRVASLAELLPEEQLQEAEKELGTPLPQVFQSAKIVYGDGLSEDSPRRLQEPNPWTILLPQTLAGFGKQAEAVSQAQHHTLPPQSDMSKGVPGEQTQEQELLQPTSDPSTTSTACLQTSLFEDL